MVKVDYGGESIGYQIGLPLRPFPSDHAFTEVAAGRQAQGAQGDRHYSALKLPYKSCCRILRVIKKIHIKPFNSIKRMITTAVCHDALTNSETREGIIAVNAAIAPDKVPAIKSTMCSTVIILRI